MVEQRTRDYELMMIISPEANETEIDAARARVAGFIADRGGLVYDQDYWGLRRLAYPIQKFHEGNYVLTRFALEPAEIIELDSSLKASDDVMRHLTMKLDKSVKVEPPEPEPEAEPEEEATEEPVAQAEDETPEAPVAEAESPAEAEEAAEETPEAPVAEAEPVAQAEAEPVEAEAPAEPVAQAEAEPETPAEPVAEATPVAQAEAEAEAPAEPATEEGRAEA